MTQATLTDDDTAYAEGTVHTHAGTSGLHRKEDWPPEDDDAAPDEEHGEGGVSDSPVAPEVADRVKALDTFDIGAVIGVTNGSDYLEAKWRIAWFRHDHPDGTITTRLLDHEPGVSAVFICEVTTPGGGFANAYGTETQRDFKDYIEKAETKSVARALDRMGYGTGSALFAAGRSGGGGAHNGGGQRGGGYQRPPGGGGQRGGYQQRGGGAPSASVADLVGQIKAGKVTDWPKFWNDNSKGLSKDDQRQLQAAWKEQGNR